MCNFVPVKRSDYRIGVPYEGTYEQIFSTDDIKYGGSGEVDNGKIKAKEFSMHGCDYSISLTIPGLSAMFFKYVPPKTRRKKGGEKIDVTETAAVKETASSKKKTAKKPASKTSAAKKTAAEKAANTSAEAAPKKRGRRPKTDKSAE